MAIRPVLRMGNPHLQKPCVDVTDFDDPALQLLINDMFDTMRAESGAGLAANQIGANRRVVIFGFEHNPRYPDCPPIPETVLINPVITQLDQEMEQAWEGCLSIPGMRGLVPRYKHIRYQGYDQHGNRLDVEAADFHARVVQHECDHLDGILYPYRIIDMNQFGFIEELEDADAMSQATLPCESHGDACDQIITPVNNKGA